MAGLDLGKEKYCKLVALISAHGFLVNSNVWDGAEGSCLFLRQCSSVYCILLGSSEQNGTSICFFSSPMFVLWLRTLFALAWSLLAIQHLGSLRLSWTPHSLWIFT